MTDKKRRENFVDSYYFEKVIQAAFASQAFVAGTRYELWQSEDEYAHINLNIDGRNQTLSTDITDMELPELLIAVTENIDRYLRGCGDE